MSASERGGEHAGIICIDKPAGPTSHDVVDWIRWALRTRSVGHCGTLDPAASGLLVVCVGWATRCARYLTDDDKTYRASFMLGRATTTGDAEGDVEREEVVPSSAWDCAAPVLQAMVGRIMLSPPRYSAVHVDGRRAHARARDGEDVTIDPRDMEVADVGDLEVDRSTSTVSATLRVSKGTYVRSLAVELGRRLGVPAHLGGLRRLHSGALSVEGAVDGLSARAIEPRADGVARWRIRPRGVADDDPRARDRIAELLSAAVRSPIDALDLPIVRTDDGPEGAESLRRLSQGQTLTLPAPGLRGPEPPYGAAPRVLVAGRTGELWVARVEAAQQNAWGLHPERLLSSRGPAA